MMRCMPRETFSLHIHIQPSNVTGTNMSFRNKPRVSDEEKMASLSETTFRS